jgi:hypothetical protein
VAAFGGLKKFKMAAVAMVTKVQNGRQIQKSSDLGEIWFPSRWWIFLQSFMKFDEKNPNFF